MSRRILIIGNSDGIGAAVTKILVELGNRVVGVSRSRSPLAGPSLRHEIQDVASPQYRELLSRLVVEEGGFDACIYCVGIGSALKLPDLSNETKVLEVNLKAMVETMEVLVPHWIERKSGHFIGLSSLADGIYNRDAPSYSASPSVRHWSPRRGRSRGDKMKRDVVLRRLTFVRCRAAFNQVERAYRDGYVQS